MNIVTSDIDKKYVDINKARIFYDSDNRTFKLTGSLKKDKDKTAVNLEFSLDSDLGKEFMATIRKAGYDNFYDKKSYITMPRTVNLSIIPHEMGSLDPFHQVERNLKVSTSLKDETMEVSMSYADLQNAIPLGVTSHESLYTVNLFDRTNSNIFINGLPGTGKSMVLASTMDILYKTNSHESVEFLYYEDNLKYESNPAYKPFRLEGLNVLHNQFELMAKLRMIMQDNSRTRRYIIGLEGIDALINENSSSCSVSEMRVNKAIRAEILEKILLISRICPNVAFIFTAHCAYSKEFNGIKDSCETLLHINRNTNYDLSMNEFFDRELPFIEPSQGRGYVMDTRNPNEIVPIQILTPNYDLFRNDILIRPDTKHIPAELREKLSKRIAKG